MPRRHLVLPSRGVAIVNTDVHGNLEDFVRLETLFREERAKEPETHWVILGDVVHGPDPEARRSQPELYDYPDGSMEIVDRIRALREEAPAHVHFVLGNHDHGHVGGHHTQKFYEDEVEALEGRLSGEEKARMHALFGDALLAVAAPCGVLMTHGAPDDSLSDLGFLDEIPLSIREMKYAQRMVLRSLLTSYGQPDPVAKKMLGQVSTASGLTLGIIIHGHDRDPKGWFVEGDHQLCPVIFGAERADKRYVRLDLSARYGDAHALRDGEEIRRLYAT